MDDDNDDARKQLENLCSSDALSVDALRGIIDSYYLPTQNAAYEYHSQSPCFHMACINQNVTLEIIEYLLGVYPSAAGTSTTYFCPHGESLAYPIHLCCYNEYCPSSVIKTLVEKYPEAISTVAMVKKGINRGENDSGYFEGLPIHYYLSRTSNLDIDTVKMLVELYPDSLITADDDIECYPIHVILYNPNVSNLLEILKYLMEYEPDSVRITDKYEKIALHIACRSKVVTLEVFQLIYNAWAGGVLQRDIIGRLPIHELCLNENVDEDTWFSIFDLMMNIDHTIVRERDDDEQLPIHEAAASQSTNVCKKLIDLYPESLRDVEDTRLPIHDACRWGTRDDTVDTIQYMLDLNPGSINARGNDGRLPIHNAAQGRNAKVVKLLLMHDPTAASKKTTGPWYHQQLPLHLACCADEDSIDIVQLLFDAYPEGIWDDNADGDTPVDLAGGSGNLSVVQFLETQLEYAEKASDIRAMTTLDENGWLPLHRALKEGAPLGSIKLLLRGSPSAVQTVDKKLAFPLHIACEFSSAKVVKYLVEQFGTSVKCCDKNKDSILHYACRGSNLSVVKYMLKSHAQLVSSATVNDKNELPVHLLCESRRGGGGDDSETTEYIETIWLLLLANPEVVVA